VIRLRLNRTRTGPLRAEIQRWDGEAWVPFARRSFPRDERPYAWKAVKFAVPPGRYLANWVLSRELRINFLQWIGMSQRLAEHISPHAEYPCRPVELRVGWPGADEGRTWTEADMTCGITVEPPDHLITLDGFHLEGLGE
jgi:hypothetical protein